MKNKIKIKYLCERKERKKEGKRFATDPLAEYLSPLSERETLVTLVFSVVDDGDNEVVVLDEPP